MCKLDYRKIIIIALLARVIAAASYDIFVSVTHNDILLPDSLYYSIGGRYVALLLNGYDSRMIMEEIGVAGQGPSSILDGIMSSNMGSFPKFGGIVNPESNLFFYIVGLIYFIFGHITIAVRVFNISLSILSTYFIFKISERHFGKLAANIFLIVALFLPSHLIYSITLSRDLVRTFLFSLALWLLYGGVICLKRQKG